MIISLQELFFKRFDHAYFIYFLKSWFRLFLIVFFSIFLFFDEEPFFDITDWNIIHILFLMLCFISITYENIIKSKYGQFVFKDQTLLFSTFSYYFFLQNYVLIVIIVFCFHCLTPLEIELFELIELYNSLLCWLSYTLFFCISIIFLFIFFILYLNYSLNWEKRNLNFFILGLLFLFLAISLILSICDFLFSSLSGYNFWSNIQLFYIQNKNSLTFNNLLYINDQFDWHKDQTNSFILRFEDLYIYFIQLIFIVIFSLNFIILLFLVIDTLALLKNKNIKSISFLFYSVFITFSHNSLFFLFLNYIVLFFVGLRVTLKILFETWGFFL